MHHFILVCCLFGTLSSYACYIEPYDQLIHNTESYSIKQLLLPKAIHNSIYNFNHPKQYLVIDGDSLGVIATICGSYPEYICNWESQHDSLFLTNIISTTPFKELEKVDSITFSEFHSLKNLFNITSNRVFAHWISDTLISYNNDYQTYMIINNGRIIESNEHYIEKINGNTCGHYSTVKEYQFIASRRLENRFYTSILLAILLFFSYFIYTNIRS